jgi:hypothetical protein
MGSDNSTAPLLSRSDNGCLVKGVLRSGRPNAGRVGAELSAGASSSAEAAYLRMAFYGDLFFTPGQMGEDILTSEETEAVADGLAVALLRAAMERGDSRLAAEAAVTLAQTDPTREGVEGVRAITRGAMSHLDSNRWLSARIFGASQRARPDLVQVARYLTEDPLRTKILAKLNELLDHDTLLVVAHSLGSIVGWEACRQYAGTLPMLLTIGSPLGLDSIVYPRLRPPPPVFPPGVQRWVNVAHSDDIIAVEPRLASLFPSLDNRRVEDHTPRSRRDHHAATVYLEQPEVGQAVVDALMPSA